MLSSRITNGAIWAMVAIAASMSGLTVFGEESGKDLPQLSGECVFETEGKVYSDFVVANMGHHGATTDLGAKLFSSADWEYMAGVTDEESDRETALFAQVETTAPGGMKDFPR